MLEEEVCAILFDTYSVTRCIQWVLNEIEENESI